MSNYQILAALIQAQDSGTRQKLSLLAAKLRENILQNQSINQGSKESLAEFVESLANSPPTTSGQGTGSIIPPTIPMIGADGIATYHAPDGEVRARAMLTDCRGSLAGIEAEIASESEPLPWLSVQHRADALEFARALGTPQAVVEHVRGSKMLEWQPGQLHQGIRFRPGPDEEGGCFVRGMPSRNIGSGVVDGFVRPQVDGIRRELREGGWIMPWAGTEQRDLMLAWLRKQSLQELPDRDRWIENVRDAPCV